ncbi:hypothetical protein J6590_054306 [Homalodisca vitripennis]|nr:hypothetical protein J6590_054306 [Homalodisca vitripennis]
MEENICMSSDVSTNHVTVNNHTLQESKQYPLETELRILEELILPDFYDSEFQNFNTLYTNDTNDANVPSTNDTNFIGSGFYPLNASSTNIENSSDSGVVPVSTPPENNSNFLDTGFVSPKPYQSSENHLNQSQRSECNFKTIDFISTVYNDYAR